MNHLPGPIEQDDPPAELVEALVRAGTGSQLHWSGRVSMAVSNPRVSVIGTRNPSAESIAIISRLVDALVARSVITVSGAAPGTDLQAHLATLRAGGKTIAIAPQGIGTITAKWRDPLLSQDRGELLLLSPFGPNRAPSTQTPVIRNRLIAALGEAVIIGEFSPTSGTCHCMDYARKLGLPLFVLSEYGGDGIPPDTALLHRELQRKGATLFSLEERRVESLVDHVVQSADAFRRELEKSLNAQQRLF